MICGISTVIVCFLIGFGVIRINWKKNVTEKEKNRTKKVLIIMGTIELLLIGVKVLF